MIAMIKFRFSFVAIVMFRVWEWVGDVTFFRDDEGVLYLVIRVLE